MILRVSSKSNDENPECPQCGAERVWRPIRPYPVGLQVGFALSFGVFLLVYDRLPRLPGGKIWLWGWSALQVAVGIVLVRARNQARQRVLRCIRCG